jgi:hypothetical protein
LSENIQRKFPDMWLNRHWALHHDNAPAHVSLVMRQLLAATNKTVTPTSLLAGPVTSPISQDEIEGQLATLDSIKKIQNESQDVMKTRYRNIFQQCFRS